jgi:hypothetical protein
LIVENGRLNGSRKALGAALTLIGGAEGCDVRLNVEDVFPIHCALVRTSDGLHLRSFPGAITQRNGEPIAEGVVSDGDLLTVGPFQFRVALPAAPEPVDRASLEREKDALRIQAAAVAAQQAAVTEEEARLQHRRLTLERQEAQLSIHLEERRQKLVELQGEVRAARLALRTERTDHEKRVAETTADLLRARREIEVGQEKLSGERLHLAELHRRLQRRHAAHWAATEASLRKREDGLGADLRKLEADRTALNEARLRFNGEAELGRRQLRDGWGEFRQAQKRWEERRGQEDAELRRRARELSDGEYLLGEHRRQWEETRQSLEAEAEGLESRVRNLRRKVQDQEKDAQPGGTVPPLPAPAEAAVARSQPEFGAAERQRLTALEALAGELADRRLHLLEQAARLAQIQQEWQAAQASALAELDEASRHLQERETQLEPRDRALADAEAELRRRGEVAAQQQAQLDGRQAQLAGQEAACEADRESLLTEVRAREEAVGRQAEALAELRRRWAERRKKDIAALRGGLQRCRAARRQYGALWEECLNHGAALEQQLRALAERALALEQYRLEVIGRAPDSAAAEKRLERLRRRCAAPTAAARRNLDRERQALEAETRRVHHLAQQTEKQATALAQREADLSRRLADWELAQVGAEADRARLLADVQSLTAQRNRHQREAQALRDEVERLARLMIDDGPTLLPVGQAA